MLWAALDEEVEAYLGRGGYQRVQDDYPNNDGVAFRGESRVIKSRMPRINLHRL